MSKTDEINKNFKKFKKILPALIGDHFNEHALMRHGKVIAIYSTAQDAVQTGYTFYEDGLFSVQKITDTAVDLGYFSHVMPIN